MNDEGGSQAQVVSGFSTRYSFTIVGVDKKKSSTCQNKIECEQNESGGDIDTPKGEGIKEDTSNHSDRQKNSLVFSVPEFEGLEAKELLDFGEHGCKYLNYPAMTQVEASLLLGNYLGTSIFFSGMQNLAFDSFLLGSQRWLGRSSLFW